MDDVDHATAQHEKNLSRRVSNRVRYAGTSATHCGDCDEPIPERRRQAIPGCQRCTDCQEIYDIRNRS